MSHQSISFIKSGLRLIGYAMMVPFSWGLFLWPAIILIVSEFVGIVEEVGHE